SRCPRCFDCPPGETSRFLRGKLADMSEVTQILSAIEAGDPQAAGQLLPLVYDELRKLAAQRLAQEKPGQTLQATALVHEAYLRLVGGEQPQPWNGRGHFFAAAAEAMRRILVEAARRRKADKRGGGWQRQELIDAELAVDSSGDDLFAVDEALSRLAAEHPRAARLVHLRFFLGLTLDEAAAHLGLRARTAYRDWAYARAWLRRQLDPADRPGPHENPVAGQKTVSGPAPGLRPDLRAQAGPARGMPWPPGPPSKRSSCTPSGWARPPTGPPTWTTRAPATPGCGPPSRPSWPPTT